VDRVWGRGKVWGGGGWGGVCRQDETSQWKGGKLGCWVMGGGRPGCGGFGQSILASEGGMSRQLASAMDCTRGPPLGR